MLYPQVGTGYRVEWTCPTCCVLAITTCERTVSHSNDCLHCSKTAAAQLLCDANMLKSSSSGWGTCERTPDVAATGILCQPEAACTQLWFQIDQTWIGCLHQ
jgi:hypothetical protein